ncbi:Hypothetical protein, putative [Bodo saltans]|uniref:Uncharacterized protein n=1 Tax=Bodo saltans TaxID=75058 RepID=A0A0S4JIK8_BODSA|nr:Hypothetical protein, putative [Bodo saltans]|eukprot:CUG88834.1 Hypothetical protein, putative [Bodo saltans]
MLSDDLLPQPYRTVNKIVQGIVSAALDEIGKRLQQGCVVDKQFVVPRTMLTVPLHIQRITTPIDAPTAAAAARTSVVSRSHSSSAPSPSVTCSRLGIGECIQGLSNGAVRIVTSDGSEPEYTSLPIVTDGPVVSVALSRPLYTEPVYAVASASSVVVIAVDVRDATPPPSPIPVSGFNGVASRTVCVISPQQLADAMSSNNSNNAAASSVNAAVGGAAATAKKTAAPVISTVQLSLDGLMLAIGVDGDSAVLVYSIPPPPPAPASAVVTPGGGAAGPSGPTGSSTTPQATPEPPQVPLEAPRFVLMATPPSSSELSVTSPTSPTSQNTFPSGGGFVSASFDFFCRPQQQQISLGYLKEHRGKLPLSAVSLFVAWCGSSIISKFPLAEFFVNSQESVQEAKKILQAAQSQQAANAANTAAASAAAGTGKGGKAGKGGAAAAAPSESSTAAATTVGSYPEVFFSGRRDLQLSQKIITAVFDVDRQRCALGCLNGLIFVHDGTTICNTFSAASHRLKQQTINELIPVSLHFAQPMSLQQLVVGFAVQRLANRCFVDVYDLSNGSQKTPDVVAESAQSHISTSAKKSPTTKTESSSNENVTAATAPHTLRLPMYCVSRMKYLNQLRAVIPIGGLPLAIILVDQGAFVLDTTRGDVVARLKESGTDAFMSGALLTNVPSVGSGEPVATDALGSVIVTAVGIDGAVSQAHIAAQSFAVVSADSVLLSPQGTRRGHLPPALVEAAATHRAGGPVRGTRSPSESSLTSASHPSDAHNSHNNHSTHRGGGGIVRSDDFSVFRMDSAALVSEMYPVLEPLLSTTYGQLPPLLIEALRRFFHDVPHSRRNDPKSAEQLGQRLATLQQAQHQVATLHHAAGSAAVSNTGGGRSAQPSLGGTLTSTKAPHPPGGDGRLSRNSTQSKAMSATTTKLRPSVTPAAAMSGVTPSSAAQGGGGGGNGANGDHDGWTGSIRAHITQREDTRHLRKDRVHDFWEAMKKR